MTTSNKTNLVTTVPPLSSGTLRSCLLGSLLIGATATRADVIELLNGDLLTGTISALNKDSAIIDSPISSTPLAVRASAIKRITFPGEVKNSNSHTERITLVNGDSLPCQLLSMNEETLRISTWYAGDFDISRKDIHALRFGLSEERTVYAGTDTTEKWGTAQGSWTFSGDTYTSKTTGVLARELDMPENVRIRFDFAWQSTPNFAFRFCGESEAAKTKQDTYELIFNRAGMQISRYQGGKEHVPLANIDLKPHEVSSKKISIDLRINRNQGTLTLYLDGKKIDTWPDTFDAAKGNHIIFYNRASSSDSCTISKLRISDWNDGSPTRHLAKIPSAKADVLIDSEGEKISGHIASISQGKTNNRTIQFDTQHSTKPIMVPDRRVSILYFKEAEESAKLPKSIFTAHLSGHGTLQLEQPQLKDGRVSTRHPILGPFTLDPKALASIEQSQKTTEKSEKGKP